MADPEARTVLFEDLKILPPVNTRAELPADARHGHVCMVRNEGKIYQFLDESWTPVEDEPA